MLDWLILIQSELMLYAACGFFLFGIEDIAFDLIWLAKRRPDECEPLSPKITTLQRPYPLQKVAIFIPAWQEEGVIGQMLRHCENSWSNNEFTIFVGIYKNDAKTRSIASEFASAKIVIVIIDRDGPTTKADCLNCIWQAALVHSRETEIDFDLVLLHDAEDRVHPYEIELFSRLPRDMGMAQIPVIPIPDRQSPWISGHYLDEFAEAHQKDMMVRMAMGGSLPSAGTGSAIARHVLEELARQRDGVPFDAVSLTEDYELGLRISEAGYRSQFLRVIAPDQSSLIAVHSSFPQSLNNAVKQKSRWTIGIALAGWDRTGWAGGWVEHWMRWRDRRSLLAATLIAAAYASAFLFIVIGTVRLTFPFPGQGYVAILAFNAAFFLWRMTMRATCTYKQYGWRQSLHSIPRMFISNFVSVLAAMRALRGYCQMLRTGKIVWEKTGHIFPNPLNDGH